MRTFFVIFGQDNKEGFLKLLENAAPAEFIAEAKELLATDKGKNIGLVVQSGASDLQEFNHTRFIVDLIHDVTEELETIIALIRNEQDPNEVATFIATQIGSTVRTVKREDGLPHFSNAILH